MLVNQTLDYEKYPCIHSRGIDRGDDYNIHTFPYRIYVILR